MKIDKIFRYILLVAAATTVWSCKEDKLGVYDDDNDVYFTLQRWDMPKRADGKPRTDLTFEYGGETIFNSWSWTYEVYDSLYRTYFYFPNEVKTSRIYVPISYMGSPKPYDRNVKYSISSSSTAQENTHFRILDAYIPANATMGAVVIEALLDGLADNVTRNIDLHLEPNDEFTTNFKTVSRSRTDETTASVIDFRVTISRDVLPPFGWVEYMEETYFGKFSKTKFLLLLEVCEIDPAVFYHTDLSGQLSLPTLNAYKSVFVIYLQERIAAGNPVMDEDGNRMTVPGLL